LEIFCSSFDVKSYKWGENVREQIKIYIRSEEKIYLFIEEKIYFYENQDLSSVLESLDEYSLSEEVEISLILHFSYFKIEGMETDYEDNNIKNIENFDDEIEENIEENGTQKLEKISFKENFRWEILKEKILWKMKEMKYLKKKFFLNHIEDKYVTFGIEKKKIEEFKNVFKQEKKKLLDIKVDITSIYNYNKNEDTEILTIGERKSLRFVIEDSKISEFEEIDLKIDDLENLEEYDFSDMKTVGLSEDNLKEIFLGTELYEEPNFLKKEKFFDDKNLKKFEVKDVAVILLIGASYIFLQNLIPLEREKAKNERLKNETKKLEKEYLSKKNEKLPDYSKELSLLEEVDSNITRKEYYSFIKFLIENSRNGVDYTKINYSDNKWIVQGTVNKFENFEKFENNLERKYSSTELGYLKDNDEEIVFEYTMIDKKNDN
jgi:hypothetical protein